MKLSNNVAPYLIALLVLSPVVARPVFGQESLSAQSNSSKQMQIEACQNYLGALQALKDFFTTEANDDYALAHSKSLSSYNLIAFLQNQTDQSTIDTVYLPNIKEGDDLIRKISLERLREIVESGNDAGAMIFFGGLNIYANDARELIDKLSIIYFSCTWKSKRGNLRMRAFEAPSLLRQFDDAGLTQVVKPITLNIRNKLGMNILLNPAESEFTIFTSDRRHYASLSATIRGLSFEDLPYGTRQSIFDTTFDIPDGADTSVVLLFPVDIPSPKLWKRIVVNSKVAELERILSKRSLIKEQ